MELERIKVHKIGKREWLVLEDFSGVPAGFISNGASVPRLLWWFLDPATEAFEAAVLHDYALTLDGSKYKMQAHKSFKSTMINYNVKVWKAYIAYWFVCTYWFIKGSLKCQQN